MLPSTKQKNFGKAMSRAVRVVRGGDMDFWRASKYFPVPKRTLGRIHPAVQRI